MTTDAHRSIRSANNNYRNMVERVLYLSEELCASSVVHINHILIYYENHIMDRYVPRARNQRGTRTV